MRNTNLPKTFLKNKKQNRYSLDILAAASLNLENISAQKCNHK